MSFDTIFLQSTLKCFPGSGARNKTDAPQWWKQPAATVHSRIGIRHPESIQDFFPVLNVVRGWDHESGGVSPGASAADY